MGMSGKELVGDVLKVEGCVDVGFGSEGRRNVVQVEGVVEVVEELVEVFDVEGGVGSEGRRNVLLLDGG